MFSVGSTCMTHIQAMLQSSSHQQVISQQYFNKSTKEITLKWSQLEKVSTIWNIDQQWCTQWSRRKFRRAPLLRGLFWVDFPRWVVLIGNPKCYLIFESMSQGLFNWCFSSTDLHTYCRVELWPSTRAWPALESSLALLVSQVGQLHWMINI